MGFHPPETGLGTGILHFQGQGHVLQTAVIAINIPHEDLPLQGTAKNVTEMISILHHHGDVTLGHHPIPGAAVAIDLAQDPQCLLAADIMEAERTLAPVRV